MRDVQCEHESSTTAVEPLHSPPIASSLRRFFGNRTRLIQITMIVVAIGIGFLMWGKSK